MGQLPSDVAVGTGPWAGPRLPVLPRHVCSSCLTSPGRNQPAVIWRRLTEQRLLSRGYRRRRSRPRSQTSCGACRDLRVSGIPCYGQVAQGSAHCRSRQLVRVGRGPRFEGLLCREREWFRDWLAIRIVESVSDQQPCTPYYTGTK